MRSWPHGTHCRAQKTTSFFRHRQRAGEKGLDASFEISHHLFDFIHPVRLLLASYDCFTPRQRHWRTYGLPYDRTWLLTCRHPDDCPTSGQASRWQHECFPFRIYRNHYFCCSVFLYCRISVLLLLWLSVFYNFIISWKTELFICAFTHCRIYTSLCMRFTLLPYDRIAALLACCNDRLKEWQT